MSEQWITVREAADILGVSETTVRRRVRDGKLESRREVGDDGGKRLLVLCPAREETVQPETAPPATAPDVSAIVEASLQQLRSTELASLSQEIAEIKAYLSGQLTAEVIERLQRLPGESELTQLRRELCALRALVAAQQDVIAALEAELDWDPVRRLVKMVVALFRCRE